MKDCKNGLPVSVCVCVHIPVLIPIVSMLDVKADREKMAFLHFNFTHIFFEANESFKYGARLKTGLLKADIFTQSGTLSLQMKSLYLAVEGGVYLCVCVCVCVHVYMRSKDHLVYLLVLFRVNVCLCCVQVHVLAHTCFLFFFST